MKLSNLTRLLVPLAMVIGFSSCIQDEAPNAEADIEACIVPGDILISAPMIENDRITLMIHPAADITQLAIDFSLSAGATIDPVAGTVRDFTLPQEYTVTSEDRLWSKTYTVTCLLGGIGSSYDFENYRIVTDANSKPLYHEFYELVPTQDPNQPEVQNIWASGNPGFKIVASGKLPEDYPTVSFEEGMLGRSAKLETRSTGFAGALLKMPLAAGNLFIGSYSGSLSALTATHFGVPFTFDPTALTGYYKYKAGEVFTDRQSNVVPGKKDNFDIYAIMYETDETVKYLDGTNSLTSPNLVSIARISDAEKKETDEWTHFYLPFELLPGKEIDPVKLADHKYSVSVVFSSSIDGATFSGAVGSTLYIDQVKLVHSGNE